MEKRAFLNRIRSLFNIDGDLLPELTGPQRLEFVRNPVRFVLEADERQSDAIMREVERRQQAVALTAATETTKTRRAVKAKRKIEGQTEMLLPIAGGGPAKEPATKASPVRRAG